MAISPTPSGPSAGAGSPILEVQGVSKHFAGLRAVDGCTLSVRRGTITGLIGPNGAGKTTLFNLITGFLKPTAGQIWYEGQRIDGWPPHEVARAGLVRTFQVPHELGAMTVLENLALVPGGQAGERIWNAWFRPGLVGRQENEIIDRALEVLEELDLLHLRDAYAANLSGGQKKLLELARAMMAEPQLILLDEPGAGVNPTLMKGIVARIEALQAERGITFFVIEHDMDLIARLCSPVIVMTEGRVLTEGTPEEVRADPEVLEAYLGGQAR